ncbi:hypothetical protein MKW98_005260 [Papaver atlanticum]|uniref:Uncharacterized protein n=1 Tax=Papaver atlanticum TaxID=357466 RepID=A0AAD4RWE9_9MAGN|nr:hypothetical protein MKW98_005260 [Papaver atlanticum]
MVSECWKGYFKNSYSGIRSTKNLTYTICNGTLFCCQHMEAYLTGMTLMPILYQDQWHLDVVDCWDIPPQTWISLMSQLPVCYSRVCHLLFTLEIPLLTLLFQH